MRDWNAGHEAPVYSYVRIEPENAFPSREFYTTVTTKI
jgi:hypothetical protein